MEKDDNGVVKVVASSSSVVAKSSNGESSSPRRVHRMERETVVGFEDEALRLMEKLDGGSQRRLEIISVVGAPGVGKTTLVKKVFKSRRIEERFSIRGWITFSQEYDKRDLLINILESASLSKPGDKEMNEDSLGEQVCKRLKDKKYLIVMDDLWSIKAWNDISRSFPNQCCGSKIIFTTRIGEVAKVAQNHPHELLPLSKGHSWELLREKVFGKQSCPSELVDVGMEIAEKCQGLPLAIVVIAGILLKTDKTQRLWREVASSLSAIIASNEEAYVKTVELSYSHLPQRLKACLFYIGAFPEDYQIPVRELIWLWIAEGIIEEKEGKSLEAIAEDYLMDLVDRNIVMIARERSRGGIKACRIHDFLRYLCLRKAEEINFLQYLSLRKHALDCIRRNVPKGQYLEGPRLWVSETRKQKFDPWRSGRVALNPNLRTLFWFGETGSRKQWSTVFPPRDLKLLRVLDMASTQIPSVPDEIKHLVRLRYLALRPVNSGLPQSIGDLSNLETFILLTLDAVKFPNVWAMQRMQKLRHLYTKRGRYLVKFTSVLRNLQTLSQICPSYGPCQKSLRMIPNIRKLGFCGDLISEDSGRFKFPALPLLEHLEKLKYTNTKNYLRLSTDFQKVRFPTAIKRLTLEKTLFKWEEMSVILGTLPSLEVLKLLDNACVGRIWDTTEKEEGFCKLKYLKFRQLNIQNWNAYFDNFPRLEIVVVEECQKLMGFPSDFSCSTQLQKIEVRRCSTTLEDSARQIKKEHYENTGDECFKIVIR